MKLKDLHTILDLAHEKFINTTTGVRLDGMNRPLEHREMVAASYLMAVSDFLYQRDGIKYINDPDFVIPDSNTVEEDYE